MPPERPRVRTADGESEVPLKAYGQFADHDLMNRPVAELGLAVIMLDGIELHGRTNVVALGITTDGDKLALGVRARSRDPPPEVQGYRGLATLAVKIEADLLRRRQAAAHMTEEDTAALTV